MKAVVLGKFRSAITVGLMFWCAGAGCTIVSYAHGAAVSGANTARGETSGSMGAHSCHASEHHLALSTKHISSSDFLANLKELAEFPNSSNATSCCPLTSGTFVVNGRQRISNDEASESPAAKAVSVLTSFTAPPFAMPLRLPNQKQTYLRGCVFLI
jgi:hypothetical protein